MSFLDHGSNNTFYCLCYYNNFVHGITHTAPFYVCLSPTKNSVFPLLFLDGSGSALFPTTNTALYEYIALRIEYAIPPPPTATARAKSPPPRTHTITGASNIILCMLCSVFVFYAWSRTTPPYNIVCLLLREYIYIPTIRSP